MRGELRERKRERTKEMESRESVERGRQKEKNKVQRENRGKRCLYSLKVGMESAGSGTGR